MADTRFYDSPERAHHGTTDSFILPTLPKDEGWNCSERGGWYYCHPNHVDLPDQGWKIHVSTSIEDAEAVLEIVADYCTRHELSFKFIPTKMGLLVRNMKYADRAASGKFITIYPLTTKQAIDVADCIDSLLHKYSGPYILSDLRWNSGPVFLRYGAFRPKFMIDASGMSVPAITDPQGKLVPDVREPRFTPPEWLTLPPEIQQQIAKLGDSEPPKDFSYSIERPLHFSNGGGVYLARETNTGRQVVLKEARPYAGVDPSGRDAVARLNNEALFLSRLDEDRAVVDFLGIFDVFEHKFMAEAYIEGQSLNTAMVAKFPLIHSSVTQADIESYTTWALDIINQVETTLTRIHSQGIVFGDLHPNNLMLTPEGRVVFLDLEMAHSSDESGVVALGAPGYVPPDGREGILRDRYALGCFKLALFCPLNPVFPLDATKVTQYLDLVDDVFSLPNNFRQSVLDDIGFVEVSPEGESEPMRAVRCWGNGELESFSGVIGQAAAAIVADATPSRSDRLYPGDINQHLENGLGLAHGVAGVILTLHNAGIAIPQTHFDWFTHACRSTDMFNAHFGLFDGISGAAIALNEIDSAECARDLMNSIKTLEPELLPSHLYGGLAGVGLTHLYFAREWTSQEHFDLAAQAGKELLKRTDYSAIGEKFLSTPGSRAGLMHGHSGHSIFLLALFEITGDSQYLEAAHAAISRDLDACVVVPDDGSLQVNEGWRVMPYVATGSAGIGLAINRYLQYADAPELKKRLEQIHQAVTPRFIIGAGLFNGRAGLLHYLLEEERSGHMFPDTSSLISAHTSDLSWHATTSDDGIALVGDQLMRLSHDFATGTAGIIATLQATVHRPMAKHALIPLIPTRGDRPSTFPRHPTRRADTNDTIERREIHAVLA